ncbi:unnamed protein product [Brassicogethes aeneus]|uniref:Nicastrin n=1 Tax=Brassicogethes aeneus TaxID=1431903 RepID=A0A9P0AUJ1_BRAAE|nr:unnamed protein product [Brassicogethes aeneus]
MLKRIYLPLLFFVIIAAKYGYADRTKDKMYYFITNSTGCYRRMNGTHQIGCTSKRGGSNGVIHYCESEKDLDFILENGKAPPYIPVMPNNLLTLNIVNKLKKNIHTISGLVIHNKNTPEYFTHDNQCPNINSNLKNTCGDGNPIWNKHGTGLLFNNIPFPLFFIDSDEDVKKIKDCFQKFNNHSFETQNERTLCSLQLKSFMFGATSTPTCQRRSNKQTNIIPVKFCDPLGDYNIWSSLYPVTDKDKNPIQNASYIVISAKMDTTSMFEKTAGAQSPITGLVTLLGVSKYLKTILPENPTEDKNVLFLLFNGETYDYIGSQRMLYDMKNGNFPVKNENGENDFLPVIRPEQISLFIEISPIKSSKNLYVHHLKDNEKIAGIVAKLQNATILNIYPVKGSLPPASLHTFVKNDHNFPGAILTDYEKTFSNNFYNSIYDNSSNIAYKYYNVTEIENGKNIPKNSIQGYIVDVATALAKSVYQELKGEIYRGDQKLDIVLIDELLHCYLENPNCRVHQVISGPKLQKTPFSLYVGIDNHSNLLTPLVAMVLGWTTGDISGEGNINCTNIPKSYSHKFYNMSESIYDLNSTKCFKVTLNQTEAISPAFIIDDYDWSSGQYSTWSESTWDDISMRVFLKPSPAHEKLTISIGSISMILSFAIVYFFKTRSHILFIPSIPNETPTEC